MDTPPPLHNMQALANHALNYLIIESYFFGGTDYCIHS